MTRSSAAPFRSQSGRAFCAGATGVVLAAASLVAVVWASQPAYARLYRAPAPSNVVDGVIFEASNWTPDLEAGAKGESWGNHRAVIELHSANQFNPRDGHINSAMLYMEHFPYLSRLWFGEYFEYGLAADYWMTEVSGLPVGLMGEMLQDGGHPYRGLLFGMTSRLYGTTDPRPVWTLMNDFGIADSRMRGYWLADTPVRTGNPNLLATTYLEPGGTLVAIGSWSARDERVSLAMDLPAMGFTGAVRVYAPAVADLQPFAEVDPASVIVPAGQGLFLRVEPRAP